VPKPVTAPHGTAGAYKRHNRAGEPPCEACSQWNKRRLADARRQATGKPQKAGVGYAGRPAACDLWPGITAGLDARCSCTWAPSSGVYQVKVRNTSCVNHGGPLDSVLARMARWRQGVS